MLNREDFDFYYLIICSRGPGSETITVDRLDPMVSDIEFLEASETEFEKFGVCEVAADFNDEGPIIAVPAGTKPLKAIYTWLKNYCAETDAEYAVGTESTRSSDPETRAILETLDKHHAETRNAFLSACLRVFLTSDIGSDNNPWTSINGWRKVEIEIPNKAQFELLMEATGETAEQLGRWECAVLKQAAKQYEEGTLPEREFPGC
ncbi:MAG: hypothetical protein ABSF90_26670 [Syntrophobacteraceae bacterium]|jgi:hypothetical protein